MEAPLSKTTRSDIHVVLVSSSRYWFNYRHAMNALGFYNLLKTNGIPDSQIIMMIADEYATNSRNPFKNGMYASGVDPQKTWYSENTELDYRGSDVTVQNFMNAVLGTGPKSLQHLDENSHLIILLTGHGGDNFFKFQDEEELTAQDIANLMDELSRRKKFRKALLIADTCQAFTLFDKITTPNVYALGTSLRNENAYAHHSDINIGLSVIERWTHGFLAQYNKRAIHPTSTTLHELMVAPFEGKAPLGAHVGTMGDFKELRLHEFFGTPPKKKRRHQKRKIQKQLYSGSNHNAISIHVDHFSQTPLMTNGNQIREEMRELGVEPIQYTGSSFGMQILVLLLLVLLASRFSRTETEEDKNENESKL